MAVHKIKLVKGAEGEILKEKPQKTKTINMSCNFTQEQIAKMKRISGLKGSCTDAQIITDYIKTTLYVN